MRDDDFPFCLGRELRRQEQEERQLMPTKKAAGDIRPQAAKGSQRF
jgi:hypothetical protein